MIDLKRFCGKSDPRSYLNAPYQENGHAFATNGIIGITVSQAGAGLDPAAPPMTGKLQTILDKTDDYTQVLPITLPSGPYETCVPCNGTGHVASSHCGDCGATGSFYHGRHSYDCKECSGKGKLLQPCRAEAKGAATCPDCEGFGTRSRIIDFECGGITYKFHEKYLRLIRTLPNHKFLVCSDNMATARFEFDGGAGVLMPCRH